MLNPEAALPQPSCADEHDLDALSVEEALARIHADIAIIPGCEQIALRGALGRVLARDVHSPLPVPGHANAAMDGYALRGADLPSAGTRELEVLGAAFAGYPFEGVVGTRQCVRIMTGAVMPEGADTVLMQERVERGHGTIRIGPGRAGDNVRPAGEDLAPGQVALEAGRRLTPADLGLVASLGIGEITVHRRLRVAFFSTGDELRSIGEPLVPGAIYDSNRYTLYGVLQRLGAEAIDMGVVPDVPDAVKSAFEEAGRCADVLITSGGASVGEADLILETLAAVGRVAFWNVATKPGRPIAFGRVGGAVFFGLPGNPVSVMATYYQFVQPALRRMAGESNWRPLVVQARCTQSLKKKPGRVEYQRGILDRDPQGALLVRPTGPQGSAILRSMSEADCFIILPHDWGRVEPGTLVDVQPFFGLV
jgi:molybdopterin molybdotransferase